MTKDNHVLASVCNCKSLIWQVSYNNAIVIIKRKKKKKQCTHLSNTKNTKNIQYQKTWDGHQSRQTFSKYLPRKMRFKEGRKLKLKGWRWKDAMEGKGVEDSSGNEAAASHSIASARFKNSFGMPRRGILWLPF